MNPPRTLMRIGSLGGLMFSSSKNSRIDIVSSTGAVLYRSIPARLTEVFASIEAEHYVIKTGDLVRTTNAVGVNATYKIIDPGFFPAVNLIPAGYRMQIQRLSSE